MRFRDALTLHTCPLLLRAALGATFIWFGLPKFDVTTFEGESAATLAQLGIGQVSVAGGRAPAAAGSPQDVSEPDEQAAPKESAEEQGQPDAPTGDESPAPEPHSGDGAPAPEPRDGGAAQDQDTPASAAPTEQPVEQPAENTSAQPAPEDSGRKDSAGQANVMQTVRARQVEHLTIMLHSAGHPYPQAFAWIAMITEIVGGALLLIGLFSRVWGLGLAVAMAYAFVLTSLPVIEAKMDPAATNRLLAFVSAFRATEPQQQMGAFWQIMLFVAAWCIFIGGPGALSLDRLIFRGSVEEA